MLSPRIIMFDPTLTKSLSTMPSSCAASTASTVSRAASEASSTQPKKTRKVCWDFQNGHCRFGDGCKFAHDKRRRDKKETRLCRDFAKGFCQFGDRCKYNHVLDRKLHLTINIEPINTELQRANRERLERERPDPGIWKRKARERQGTA